MLSMDALLAAWLVAGGLTDTGPQADPERNEDAADGAETAAETDDEADGTETTADPGDDPYATQAPLDVQTLLTDSSKAYLQARARLEAHPELAAEAIMDRLAAVPAPGPADRKRLLDVLARLGLQQHVELFAQELRRSVKQAGSPKDRLAAAQRWRNLLFEQGAAALPHLQRLVGDRDLPESVRALLIVDLVNVIPTDQSGDLIVLVGRGHPGLQQAFRMAAKRRAANDPTVRDALVQATDAALDRALADPPVEQEAERLPSLVRFRTQLQKGAAPELADRLAELANAPAADFGVRVSAVRGLGVLDEPRATEALVAVARRELAESTRDAQASEILGWLALQGLDEAQARPVVDALGLLGDDAPRLSTVAFRVGSLPSGVAWLKRGLADPWPQVRQAALSRIKGPCEDDTVERLAELGGPSDKGGDQDRAVARSALQAVGRCGGPRAQKELRKLLESDRVDVEQRAEAARQLAKHGGTAGANAVAKVLDQPIDRRLARRLAGTLRFAAEPTPQADAALCRRLDDDDGSVARAAARSLAELHRGEGNPCE